MRKLLAVLALAACSESPTIPEPAPPSPPAQADSVLAPGFFDLTSPEWRIAFGHGWASNSGFVICYWTGSLRIQQPQASDFTGSIVHVGQTCFDSAIGFVTPPSMGMRISNGRIAKIIGDITQITFDLQISSLPVCPMKFHAKDATLISGYDCQTRPTVIYR